MTNYLRGGIDFHCGVMSSITGLISSPSAAVYAAAKAALCRFIESVNIELESSGTPNRILNIAPGFISGTKFYDTSQPNDPSQNLDLADQIIDHMLNRDTLFIPNYEQTYRGVIDRYAQDPHAFGLSSYEYKHRSGRINNSARIITGYMSGTFDLFHVGHLNILERAKSQCDSLVVGIHGSGKRKGKETFIPLDERKRIVASCRYVDRVIDAPAEDSDAWPELHYSKLFVGSDYKGTERFKRYEEIFSRQGSRDSVFPVYSDDQQHTDPQGHRPKN